MMTISLLSRLILVKPGLSCAAGAPCGRRVAFVHYIVGDFWARLESRRWLMKCLLTSLGWSPGAADRRDRTIHSSGGGKIHLGVLADSLRFSRMCCRSSCSSDSFSGAAPFVVVLSWFSGPSFSHPSCLAVRLLIPTTASRLIPIKTNLSQHRG